MRKLTTLVGFVLQALSFITGKETKNVDMSKVSITLKYH